MYINNNEIVYEIYTTTIHCQQVIVWETIWTTQFFEKRAFQCKSNGNQWINGFDVIFN